MGVVVVVVMVVVVMVVGDVYLQQWGFNTKRQVNMQRLVDFLRPKVINLYRRFL